MQSRADERIMGGESGPLSSGVNPEDVNPIPLTEPMRYVQITQPGGPEAMSIAEGPLPDPAPHEVLIQVHAAGVNRPDLMQREGKYPPPPDASPILGLEVAGTVFAKGAEARWEIGDRVCALVPGGGYAEFCRVPAAQCLPVPQNLSFTQAAGIPETFFTVWANVFQLGRLQAGERFLVHGGTSGIGTTAIQLAKAFGTQVVATAGTAEKCEACRQLGADFALNYREVKFEEEILRLAGGVDVILDMIGGDYTARNLDCLAMDGRLVYIATQRGAEVNVNLFKIMRKRITLTGSLLRPRTVEEKGRIAAELRERVWPLLESGAVRPVIDRVFPFEQVRDAHAYLERGEHIGKVILDVKA